MDRAWQKRMCVLRGRLRHSCRPSRSAATRAIVLVSLLQALQCSHAFCRQICRALLLAVPCCPHRPWCLPDVVLQLSSDGAWQLLQALAEGAHCLPRRLGRKLGVPGRWRVLLVGLQCTPAGLMHKALCAGLTGRCCSVRLWADTTDATCCRAMPCTTSHLASDDADRTGTCCSPWRMQRYLRLTCRIQSPC